MGRIHAGEGRADDLAEIERLTRDLARVVAEGGRGDDPLAHDALQEATEAGLLWAIVRGTALPAPDDLGVAPEVYLLGLGDAVGEVRRLVLADLGQGDLDAADRRLALMDELFRALLRFDTTRAIVQLKPKQDAARSLLERTRGEVTMARVLARAHPNPPGPGGDGR